MTIVNIGSKFDLIQGWLSSNTALSNLFIGGIFSGKPLDVGKGLSLYFGLSNNSPIVETDRKGGKDIMKKALLEFVIITNQKDIPDVAIYEALDTLSNEIVGLSVNLGGFRIGGIQEANQTGVIIDTNENPLLVAQYEVIYNNKY